MGGVGYELRMRRLNSLSSELVHALSTAANVVWLTGAGLSVASGLAPYRKSRDAVWENFITDWGTLAKFREDPSAWYRDFWWKAHGTLLAAANTFVPNPGHLAITRFLRRFPGHRVITQNIDRLHLHAGAPPERTIEIHGRHDAACCPDAACPAAGEPVLGLVHDVGGALPRCERCGAVLRPVVLLFDEMYESHPLYRAREARRWLNDAEVLVFVGTSFAVGITAMALSAARYNNAIIVNVNVDAIDDFGFVNVLGPAEVTLPALADAAGA
jgi:NAD-dependent SIR2 family protein deacetylase